MIAIMPEAQPQAIGKMCPNLLRTCPDCDYFEEIDAEVVED